MKVEDLIIGDWVQYHNKATDKIEYYKIDGIDGRHNKLTITYTEINPDEIEPIPLTPEILKKNFEKKTFYGIYDDYFDLDIREYSDGLYIVTYHSCEFNIPDQTIHLSWVHELQHFMRHCEIEKEITI